MGVPPSERSAMRQALAGALLVRYATAPVGGPAGAFGWIHHLFKSMK